MGSTLASYRGCLRAGCLAPREQRPSGAGAAFGAVLGPQQLHQCGGRAKAGRVGGPREPSCRLGSAAREREPGAKEGTWLGSGMWAHRPWGWGPLMDVSAPGLDTMMDGEPADI